MEPKFQYSKDNHYKWGWGDEWFGRRVPDEPYKITIGTLSRPSLGFRHECVQASKDIANNTTKPIVVGLSGGSDSQMVCLSLIEAKVPFTALIVTYKDEFNNVINSHDTDNAYKFCKKFNVPYEELVLDLPKHYTGKGVEYAKKYGMSNAETIVQTAAMDHCKDRCYIMAGGDIMMVVVNPASCPNQSLPLMSNGLSTPTWYMKPLPIEQHMIESGFEGTSKFYMWSPELIHSYLTDPVMQNYYRAQDMIYDTFCVWHPNPATWWRCFHYLFKPQMALSHFPEMIPTRKYTGFEQLYGNVMRDNFINKLPKSRMKHYTDILKTAAGVNDDNKQAVILPIKEMINLIEGKDPIVLKSTKLVEITLATQTPERTDD